MVDAFERNVIGTGIRLQAKIKNEDGTENEALNTKIEELWRDWSRPRYCDTSGQPIPSPRHKNTHPTQVRTYLPINFPI